MDEVEAELEASDSQGLPALHIMQGAVDAERFAQLANHCLPRDRTIVHAATWQVPDAGATGAMRRAATQQHAAIPDEDDCDGLDGWALRMRHVVEVG
jgi:hypothetical protein